MDFKEYTDGKRTIKATVTMYEMLYRSLGYKPVKVSDKGRSHRNDKTENPVTDDGSATDE